MSVDTRALYDTPIGDRVDALMDAGRNIWIAGFTHDGQRALIVDADNEQVSVAHVDTANGLGRWECNIDHWRHNIGTYSERFPQR